jgi:hypothetical protein
MAEMFIEAGFNTVGDWLIFASLVTRFSVVLISGMVSLYKGIISFSRGVSGKFTGMEMKGISNEKTTENIRKYLLKPKSFSFLSRNQ